MSYTYLVNYPDFFEKKKKDQYKTIAIHYIFKMSVI